MKKCKTCKWWDVIFENECWGICLDSFVESQVYTEGTDSEDLKQTFEDFGCIYWKQRNESRKILE